MRAPFLILAAPLLLGGCAALEELDRTLSARLNPQPAPVVTVVAPPPVPLPDRKPAAPPKQITAAVSRPLAKAPPKPERPPGEEEQAAAVIAGPPPAPRRVPATLVGLSAEELRSALGQPAQEVAEAPGVRWRYPGPNCVLDVHLFPRVESEGLYALDVSASGLPVEECLERFRNPPSAEPVPTAPTPPSAVAEDQAPVPSPSQ